MKRSIALTVLGLLACSLAWSQAVIGDVLAGKLVKPKTGAWAWYDLTDSASDSHFLVRLAIVGEEKVAAKDGYWLELEVVPAVGYESVYKMLVTGPANDPANVHKILRRDGLGKPEEVPTEPEKEKGKDAKEPKAKPEAKEAEKTLVGEEEIKTIGGAMRAQHYELKAGDGKSELWTNEEVAPTGVVQMKSPEGTLLLRNYGTGGADANSVIDAPRIKGEKDKEPGVKVEVHVDKAPAKEPVKEKAPK
jgi:hypothetical protein